MGVIALDHIAVSGKTLGQATSHVEAALGVSLQKGGAHEVYGTHNFLLGLEDGLYLEAIAVDPAVQPQRRPRWFDLDRFSGPARVTNWICRCDDLDATLARLPGGFGKPVSLSRGDLRWRMAVPKDGVLPFDDCAPALIEWEGNAHPSALLPNAGVRQTALIVTHPQASELQGVLDPLMQDARITFETGVPQLEARFQVSGSDRVLK